MSDRLQVLKLCDHCMQPIELHRQKLSGVKYCLNCAAWASGTGWRGKARGLPPPGSTVHRIKALSLWQPWASLIALGVKRFETRSWDTSYRGPLLICAAKVWNSKLNNFCHIEPFRTALAKLPAKPETFCGHALCVADVVEVYRCNLRQMTRRNGGIWDAFPLPESPERDFGDYSPGRFAWWLGNIRPIKPFPVSGAQGVFTVDVDPKRLEAA